MNQIVLCDVDGTIADMGKGQPGRRGPFDWDRVGEDTPITPIFHLLKLLQAAGRYQVIFMSGRKEQCRAKTVKWIDEHMFFVPGFGPSLVLMRADDDNRPDVEVKRDLYRKHIEGHYEVAYVLDDRNSVVEMWRSLGLTVLQVADGDF